MSLSSTDYETISFQQVKVGDILIIKDGQQLPADCVVLTAQGANFDLFINTAALDGERNLKPKQAIKQVAEKLKHQFQLSGDGYKPIVLQSTKAVQDMYFYDGRITISENASLSETYPIGINQFLP